MRKRSSLSQCRPGLSRLLPAGPPTATRSSYADVRFLNQESIIGHGRRRKQAHDEYHDWITIRRGRCGSCGKTFTSLPVFSLPYTHYSLPTILAWERRRSSLVSGGEKALVGEDVERLKRLCPLHKEGQPSFYVNARKDVFYCHGCGQGGDLIRFVQLSRGLSFRQSLAHFDPEIAPEADSSAVLELAATFYQQQLDHGPEAMCYLHKAPSPDQWNAALRDVDDALQEGGPPAEPWAGRCGIRSLISYTRDIPIWHGSLSTSRTGSAKRNPSGSRELLFDTQVENPLARPHAHTRQHAARVCERQTVTTLKSDP
jgi:CHC2 zinc finger/Domain of unknown function (DUF6431)